MASSRIDRGSGGKGTLNCRFTAVQDGSVLGLPLPRIMMIAHGWAAIAESSIRQGNFGGTSGQPLSSAFRLAFQWGSVLKWPDWCMALDSDATIPMAEASGPVVPVLF